MKKLLSAILAIMIVISCGTVAFAVVAGTVEILEAVRNGSAVDVSGTTTDVNAAVAVQVLDADDNVIGMDSFVVGADGSFSGSVAFSGTAASVRAADYDGGPWKTVELPPEHPVAPPEPESYAIRLDATENGTVALSTKYAVAGQKVTLTVTPDEGYLLESVVITDKNGNEIELTDLGDGKYSFKMPGRAVSVKAIFAQLPGYATCLGDDTCPSSKFTDVDVTAWYHDGIHFCVENGIMNGVSDTKFDVTGDVTRAQIVTMLWRLDGEKYVNYAMSFEDVADEQWYTEAVRWAASEGIVNGYGDGKFGTNDPVTREQLATILYRYAQSKGQGFTGSWMFLLDFVDRADISEWADEAVHWCSMKGIVNGIGNDLFDPQGNATRAEAASMIQRFCEALEK